MTLFGAEEDLILANYRSLVRGIAETFGPLCEIVLHDFRKSGGSVVAVAGNVTNRRVGGSMSRIGLSVVAAGDDAKDITNYFTETIDGKKVKSSTLLIRNSKGKVFGSICINLDITGLTSIKRLISAFLPQQDQDLPRTLFTNDVSQMISELVQEEINQARLDFPNSSRMDRVALFKRLDLRGVFAIRGSVPAMCEQLSISRASAYSYLTEARIDMGFKETTSIDA